MLCVEQNRSYFSQKLYSPYFSTKLDSFRFFWGGDSSDFFEEKFWLAYPIVILPTCIKESFFNIFDKLIPLKSSWFLVFTFTNEVFSLPIRGILQGSRGGTKEAFAILEALYERFGWRSPSEKILILGIFTLIFNQQNID